MSGSEARRVLPIATRRATWRVLGREVRDRRGVALVTLGCFALSNVCGLLAPWVLGDLVDASIGDVSRSTVLTAVSLLVATAVGAGGLLWVGYVFMARLGEGALASLRERVVGRSLRLPTSDLQRAGSGDLLTRVGDDVATVTQAINNTLPLVIGAGLATGLTAVSMFGLDWRLGLAGLASAPVYAIGVWWYLPRAEPMYARERLAVGERAQTLVGALDGATTIRTYRVEADIVGAVEAKSEAAMGVAVRTFRMLTTFTGWLNRGELAGLSALLAVGFWLVDGGSASVGEVTTAALLFHRLFGPIGTLMVTFDDVQSAGASLSRLVGVIEMQATTAVAEPAKISPPQIRVDSVTYRYDDGPAVLEDVSLAIGAGERVALVGASGAGKTTLASIIAGQLLPTAGEVWIADESTRELGEVGVRERVALVSQDIHVFHGSLRDDLTMARPEADDDELYAALTAVGAVGWAKALPDGLSTVVGENACRLTAAQAQQLALARLLLADRPAVILDEATAEAGSAGAYELERAADVVVDGRTSIVVAHRLTQALQADRIIVLESGRVIEQGDPDTLIERGGRFARLWSAWHSGSVGAPAS